jgi:uncharacterized membrane protein YccC
MLSASQPHATVEAAAKSGDLKRMRNAVIGVTVAAVTARFVGFATPGHRLLNAIGLTTACSSDNGG